MTGVPPRRRVVVLPGMCGPGSSFLRCCGDWTWKAVSTVTGGEVAFAHDEEGRPAYLAFCSLRATGAPGLHLHRFTFGDELVVDSRVFRCGTGALVTVHRVAFAADGNGDGPPGARECFGRPRPDRLYVSTYNRWLTRGAAGGNQDLMRAAPVGFRTDHLPEAPHAHSPLHAHRLARRERGFSELMAGGYVPVVRDRVTVHPIDPVRDVNGVGLVYYAAFCDMIDAALLAVWRDLGRDDRSFLSRRVVDQRVGYLGNAEIDAVLRLSCTLWRRADDPDDEVANVVVEDAATGRLTTVGTQRWLRACPATALPGAASAPFAP